MSNTKDTAETLKKLAIDLIDDGSNTEYLRGICELIGDIDGKDGVGLVDRSIEIAQELGVTKEFSTQMYSGKNDFVLRDILKENETLKEQLNEANDAFKKESVLFNQTQDKLEDAKKENEELKTKIEQFSKPTVDLVDENFNLKVNKAVSDLAIKNYQSLNAELLEALKMVQKEVGNLGAPWMYIVNEIITKASKKK